MSLLNRPSDGTHSVLIVIYKLLSSEGAMSRDRIIGLCTPPPLERKEKVGQTLNTWIELGLFEVLSGGKIGISKSIKKANQRLENLPQQARFCVLQNNNNLDLWASEKANASDFTRAVSWLLAQDIYSVVLSGWSSAEKLLLNQIPVDPQRDETSGLIQNDTRWTGLKSWCVWLGFGWLGRHPKGVLMIDPTEAVHDALPRVFGRKETLSASEVVIALSKEVPVLDRGNYRVEVENRMKGQEGPNAWRPPPSNQLSTSLSRALMRLKGSGILIPELKADSKDRVILTGRDQSSIETVSHYTFPHRKS